MFARHLARHAPGRIHDFIERNQRVVTGQRHVRAGDGIAGGNHVLAEAWRFDMDDRNEMREIGMAGDTFRPGDRLVVTGSLARREPRRLYIQRLARPSDGFSYEQVRSRPRLRQASR